MFIHTIIKVWKDSQKALPCGNILNMLYSKISVDNFKHASYLVQIIF